MDASRVLKSVAHHPITPRSSAGLPRALVLERAIDVDVPVGMGAGATGGAVAASVVAAPSDSAVAVLRRPSDMLNLVPGLALMGVILAATQ